MRLRMIVLSQFAQPDKGALTLVIKMSKKYTCLFFVLLPCCPVSAQDTSSVFTNTIEDTISTIYFDCSPSIPLEIAASAIIWGLPSYFISRPIFHHDTAEAFYGGGIFLPLSYFLLMFSLGPTAEWTSDCEASYWHILWIGAATHLATLLTYGALHGRDNEPQYRFDFAEYLILSVIPATVSTFIYNSFLEPATKTPDKNRGELTPFLSPDFYGLRYQIRF